MFFFFFFTITAYSLPINSLSKIVKAQDILCSDQSSTRVLIHKMENSKLEFIIDEESIKFEFLKRDSIHFGYMSEIKINLESSVLFNQLNIKTVKEMTRVIHENSELSQADKMEQYNDIINNANLERVVAQMIDDTNYSIDQVDLIYSGVLKIAIGKPFEVTCITINRE